MQMPVLETDRLLLRPFEEADAKDVFECWESDAVQVIYALRRLPW